MRRLVLSASALRFFDSFLLIVPFYTVMFAERGLTPTQIGVVLASWSVMGLLLEVPCGVLADRTSRRGLLAVAQLVRCAGFFVWLAFPNFWGFLLGLMLWGLKSATFNGAFEAVIYDELKALGREAEYARVMGRAQAGRAAGVLGASLAAAPVAARGYEVLILASAAAGVFAVVAALSLPKAPKAAVAARWGYFSHLREGVAQAASLPGVPHLLLFIAAMQAVVMSCADYWPLFARDVGLPKPGIALFMAAVGAVGATSAVLAHRAGRLPMGALYLLLILGGGFMLAGALTYERWSVVLPMAFVGLYWLVDVNADARFQHALRPETRATVASVKGLAMQGATALLMLGWGVLADVTAYRVTFGAAGVAAMLVGAGFGAAAFLRRPIAARAQP
ncbi:MFS transporter [Phenylobacterium sp.]|uniref:MFS transporter n=1 Tax=Phenylobacterium sp. TaxID=1871053 RepID=UPI002F91E74B